MNISPSSIIYRKPAVASRPMSSSSSVPKPASKPTDINKNVKPGTHNRPVSSGISAPRVATKPIVDPNNNGTKIEAKDLLKLPSMDKKMIEIILEEIVDKKSVKFSDISKTTPLNLIFLKIYFLNFESNLFK